MLELRAFGALDLRDAEGSPLGSVLVQTKRVALLAYLLLSRPGELHRRDSLLALFWPEADQIHGRNSLSQALTFLRKRVGRGVLLARGTGEVGADPRHVRCDALAFQEALKNEDHPGALELYTGEFLDGLHVKGAPGFTDWVDRERVRLREAAAGASWQYAHQLIRAGSPVVAGRMAQRALELVPTDESPVREFVKALALAGDRGAALRFYQRFEMLLGEQLGVEPAPETEALVRVVRRGELEEVDSRARGFAETKEQTRPAPPLGALDDPRPGIAVLPCENLSPRAEDAYYADLLHDAIITKLQMVSGIVPTGRSSVLWYRDHPAPPSRIAQELNVAYLGESTVLKENDRIRVTFRLLEGRSSKQIWVGAFDATLALGGVIDMQGEIARRIVHDVGARLTAEEQARFALRPTDSLTAYELYMIGRNRLSQFSKEKLQESIEYFRAAIREDPRFALSHSSLGEALVLLPIYDLTMAPENVRKEARAALSRAMELDPGLGEVHAAMGLFLQFLEWDWARAEWHYLESLRLKPGDALTRLYYASLLSGLGRIQEGVEQAHLVLAMDPRSSGVMWSVGNRLWDAGLVEEARWAFQRALEIEPAIPWALEHLAISYALGEPVDLGRAAELMSEFFARLGYPGTGRIGLLVEALGGESSAKAEAVALLDEIVDQTILSRPHLLFEYAALAPMEVLFDVLEEAVEGRHIWMSWIPIDCCGVRPEIRDDPRWGVFLRRISHPGIGLS